MGNFKINSLWIPSPWRFWTPTSSSSRKSMMCWTMKWPKIRPCSITHSHWPSIQQSIRLSSIYDCPSNSYRLLSLGWFPAKFQGRYHKPPLGCLNLPPCSCWGFDGGFSVDPYAIFCLSTVVFATYPTWNQHCPLKIGLHKMKVVSQAPFFRGYVSLKECTLYPCI